MKKLILALAIVGFASPALAAKSKTVKAKPYRQCALWSPQGCATPWHYIVSPIVTAGDISMGIINGVTAPFR